MRKILVVVGLFVGIFLSASVSAQDLDPEEVRQVIRDGVQFLKNRQRPDGSWSEYAGQELCGSTSLAVLAMASCGVSKDDPSIQKAMGFLRMNAGSQEKRNRNYAVSLQTMAFCLVEPERDRPLIRANVEFLEKTQVKNGSEHDGGWHYTFDQHSDLSNSQFSILALYEAERVGVKAKKETWQRAHRYWSASQNSDGSWGYTPKPGGGCTDVRGSMTCAGIASLVITSGILGTGGATVRGGNILCGQRVDPREAEKINAGLRWMANHFNVSENPRVGSWLYYYLYALERVGRMTNHRYIDDHDWYREGTDKLIQLRVKDPVNGSWTGQGSGPEVGTAFALLFLSKGRRPVLMSKLQFTDDQSWNVHPNDVNNLTTFTESQWKLDLTWQVVDVRAAKSEDLTQSPVLYLCGNRSPLQWNDEETDKLATKLRDYLDQGGFIIAEAQPDDKTFDTGFRELMSRVFPEPGYELSLLEQSHPIWSAEIPIDPEQLRPIEGINFGCRTSVVYIPPEKNPGTDKMKPSLSCLWEVARVFQREEPYPPVVQNQVDAGLGIGLNILAYATNRELKHKDEVADTVSKRNTDPEQRRGRLFLGLLDHGGGANSAPRALINLLQWTESNLGLPVELRSELVDAGGPDLFEYPILFMHGRNGFRFTEVQREKLQKHFESGGFLFANSICSTKTFSEAFRAEMQKIFPDHPLEKIEADDPIFSEEYGGMKIETLELRIPEQSPGRKMIAPVRKVVPELYGIRLEDRWVVVFSPNDVSCSLEMANSLECRGYTRSSAMQLAVNVLLYSLGHW